MYDSSGWSNCRSDHREGGPRNHFESLIILAHRPFNAKPFASDV